MAVAKRPAGANPPAARQGGQIAKEKQVRSLKKLEALKKQCELLGLDPVPEYFQHPNTVRIVSATQPEGTEDWVKAVALTEPGGLHPCWVCSKGERKGRLIWHTRNLLALLGIKKSKNNIKLAVPSLKTMHEFPLQNVLRRNSTCNAVEKYIEDRCELLDGKTVEFALRIFKYKRKSGELKKYGSSDLRYDLHYKRLTMEGTPGRRMNESSAPRAAKAPKAEPQPASHKRSASLVLAKASRSTASSTPSSSSCAEPPKKQPRRVSTAPLQTEPMQTEPLPSGSPATGAGPQELLEEYFQKRRRGDLLDRSLELLRELRATDGPADARPLAQLKVCLQDLDVEDLMRQEESILNVLKLPPAGRSEFQERALGSCESVLAKLSVSVGKRLGVIRPWEDAWNSIGMTWNPSTGEPDGQRKPITWPDAKCQGLFTGGWLPPGWTYATKRTQSGRWRSCFVSPPDGDGQFYVAWEKVHVQKYLGLTRALGRQDGVPRPVGVKESGKTPE